MPFLCGLCDSLSSVLSFSDYRVAHLVSHGVLIEILYREIGECHAQAFSYGIKHAEAAPAFNLVR